ncbi:MAG TPA: hypothetical protein VH640_17765 [Bryobacteraceae bacterium]|jgi:hypothetical protein
MQWRLALYIAAFSFAVFLDSKTPFGPAEWLIEVLLAWVATTFGGIREMILVAVIATVSMLVGLWTSPAFGIPVSAEVFNRLAAIGFIWLVVYIARARRMAEAEVKVLRGLLPICASCKRIRRGDNQWESVESYVTAHSEAMFTHGLCPECFEKYRSEIGKH